MNKDLKLLNVANFTSSNIENIKALSENIYKLALEAININQPASVEKDFKVIESNFEKLQNRLNLSNSENSTLYYFGYISAITHALLDLAEKQDNINMLKNIPNSYRLLMPALSIINKHNTISGSELQKELKIKASGLSNFLKRIEKYDLIRVNKMGTMNFLSLTSQGKQLLSQNKKKNDAINNNETHITILQLYTILDGLNNEIPKKKPNSLAVIHECAPRELSIGEKQILKQKIDRAFIERNNYITTYFSDIIKHDKYSDTIDGLDDYYVCVYSSNNRSLNDYNDEALYNDYRIVY